MSRCWIPIGRSASNVKQPHHEAWAVNVDKAGPRLLGTMEYNEEGCQDVQLSRDGERAVWAAKGQLWIAPASGAERHASSPMCAEKIPAEILER